MTGSNEQETGREPSAFRDRRCVSRFTREDAYNPSCCMSTGRVREQVVRSMRDGYRFDFDQVVYSNRLVEPGGVRGSMGGPGGWLGGWLAERWVGWLRLRGFRRYKRKRARGVGKARQERHREHKWKTRLE